MPRQNGKGRSAAREIVTAVNDAYARKNIVTAILKQNIESTVFGDLDDRLAMAEKELADLRRR